MAASNRPVSPPQFREVQGFQQWWLILILLIPSGIMLYGAYVRFVLQQPFGHVGSEPSPLWLDVTMFIVIGLGLPYLMTRMKLIVEVHADGLYYRFVPLHFRWQFIGFDQIKTATATTYRPILDYGGWGIRYGAKGKAYNVSGNEGVFLALKNGSNVLFGSRKMLELEMALRSNIPVAKVPFN